MLAFVPGPPDVFPAFRSGRRWASFGIVAGGWTLFGLLSFGGALLSSALQGPLPVPWNRLLLLSLAGAWVWAALTPAVLALTRNASFGLRQPARSLGVHAVACGGFVLVSTILERSLVQAIGVEPGTLFVRGLSFHRIESGFLAYLVIVTLSQAGRYLLMYRERQLETAELEARLAKAQLQVLKMQLQPHFLFNTLNTVAELVHTDPDAADQMITRLGRLLRLALDHSGHQLVPLRQELEFLRAYLEIERARFQDRLQVVWEIAPDTLDAAVPTLLWQPVLENAIRHGVSPLAGRGRILVGATRDGGELILQICDNGRGLPTDGSALREGVGVRNVRERLEQLYGDQARFLLKSAPGGGTLALLCLPFAHCSTPHTPVPLATGGTREMAS
ncbi:MAG: sensor histidine kinase [Gemmatimonadales bacterium]